MVVVKLVHEITVLQSIERVSDPIPDMNTKFSVELGIKCQPGFVPKLIPILIKPLHGLLLADPRHDHILDPKVDRQFEHIAYATVDQPLDL